jgi:hypothetical protein
MPAPPYSRRRVRQPLEPRPAIADIVNRDDPPGAVSTAPSQTVELRLAETGAELWPAVEAAQYARLISHEPPAGAGQERAIARFVEAFVGCAETWEELEPMRRSGALAGLGAQLDALQRHGLFVHWAALEAGIAGSGGAVRMPLAILTIGPSDLPSARVQLPGELEVDPQGGPQAH